MGTVLTIGEPMVMFQAQESGVDLAQASTFRKFSAGAELNVAIGLARLGHAVDYVSAVGHDPFGAYLRQVMTQSHVGTTNLVTKTAYPTGFYLKQNVQVGDPAVAYFRQDSAAAHYEPTDLAQVDLSAVAFAHLSGIYAALSPTSLTVYRQLNQRLLDRQLPVSFDPNLRPTLWSSPERMIAVTNQLAQSATIVLPGLQEGRQLTGQLTPQAIAEFYLQQSPITQLVVVKLGAQGAYALTRQGTETWTPGFAVDQVVDTVGAGDGFAVGLISGILEHRPLPEALQRACAIGALAVQSAGDNDGYPTMPELTRFYQRAAHESRER